MTDTMQALHLRNAYLGMVSGYAATRRRATISINFHQLSTPMLDVNHELVQVPWRLTISGAVWNLPRTDILSGGQITDLLTGQLTDSPLTPAEQITLSRIWRRWHLNDLNAACAHMLTLEEMMLAGGTFDVREYVTLPDDRHYDAREYIVCPVSGYKYGTAWLYEPVPEQVIYDLHAIAAKLGRG